MHESVAASPGGKGVIMHWHDDHGMGGWGYVLMALNILLFWGLVITGVILLIRYLGRRESRSRGDAPAAERILAERFARNEISEEEYRQRLDVLRRASIRPQQ
ncbi:MAG TPA: SHOCT domain-containing protein [Micromonosporaceae bacterium]